MFGLTEDVTIFTCILGHKNDNKLVKSSNTDSVEDEAYIKED